MTARSITFTILPIWVQIRGLPFDLINEEDAWNISKGLNQLVEVGTKTFSSEEDQFICIHVEILLNKPIRQGGCVASPEGDQVRAGFKYERLVGLCYQCSIFSHEPKECPTLKEQQLTENPYGEWLKAGYRKIGDSSKRRRSSSPRRETVPKTTQGRRGQGRPFP
ncbi:hypothetical protein SO802_021184 [Lithocarpus litseifolius]|uniref:Zinc knuckle CX2CX4HX4C domain-containing protein n=1 Tax=Lithocarpus litseifolius TaxID=425828 RepID=A0AAW2CG86_9ROSI